MKNNQQQGEVSIEEYGLLSAIVYERPDKQQLSIGMIQNPCELNTWTQKKFLSDNFGGNVFADAYGFSGGIYKNGNEVVVAFTGTNTQWEHITTNIPTGLAAYSTEQVKATL